MGEVDPGSQDRRYSVHGVVTGVDGRELADAEVTVWRQRIRSRVRLVTGRTSEEGSYRLSYRPPPDDVPSKLLIIVEASSEHLASPLLSPLVEALPDLQIDLHVEPSDQSELAKLLRGITPLLDRLELTDLVENDEHQDLSFLARELGKTSEEIMRVVVAARLEAAFDIPTAAFYAFLRQRVPSALPSPLLEASQNFTLIDSLVRRIGSLIFALSGDVEERTVVTAIALDLIGQQYAAQIPQIVSQLQTQRTTDLLNQPYLIGRATLSQLLGVVQLPQAKQQTFAHALATNTLSMRNFWRTLGDGQHGFTAAEASAIEHTLSVGAFVKNYLPLVQNLLQGFADGTYKTLPDLARLSEQDWVDLMNQSGPPPSIDAAGAARPAEVFARVVYARVTRAYPTAALSSRITTSNLVSAPQRAPLTRFFENNPTLELVKHNIPVYLASQGDNAFAGIGPEDRAAVVANARRFQRVLRVVPHIDAAQTLLGLGIHSATQIAAIGRQQFFVLARGAGLTKREAKAAYVTLFGASYPHTLPYSAGLDELRTYLDQSKVPLWQVPQASLPLHSPTTAQQAAVTTERLDTADRSSARSCFRSGCVDYVRVPARTAPGQLGAGRIENRDPRDRRHFATRAFKRLHRRRSMPVF